jgi:Zn-dependent protease
VSSEAIYLVTTWAIPVIVAITFHEAAHGFVAHLLGDDTAWRLGRVSFNPVKHIDPFGTILLPGMLLLLHAPFLFGYAKPVPVNFRALRSPRRDMVLVAAAGPVMNIALALIAALAFHVVGYLPDTSAEWLADNLKNTVILNVVLAVFNLFPLPPLDGGRILVGILPKPAAMAVARLEPFGLLILIGILIILPILSAQLGVDLNFISRTLAIATRTIINMILYVTGNS